MKIFNFELTRSKPATPVAKKANLSASYYGFPESKCNWPEVTESTKYPWLSYGEDNAYPEMLISSYNLSPLHKTIVLTKGKMTEGEDILFGGTKTKAESDAYIATLDPKTQANITSFNDNPNPDDTLEDIVSKLSMDWWLQGTFAIEVIWSRDRTKIAEFRYVDASMVRIGKPNSNGIVEDYYVSRNWKKAARNPQNATRIQAFDAEGKGDYNQMIFIQGHIPGMEYYSPPDYTSAMDYIQADDSLGRFVKNHIEDGFSPKTLIAFPSAPQTDEEKRSIDMMLKSKFTGPTGSKMLVTYGDGEGNYTKAEPIMSSNASDEFISTSESIFQNIIFAHGITSPAIVGLATPGKLGYSGGVDMIAASNQFQKLKIGPAQKTIERTLNKIALGWGIPDAKIELLNTSVIVPANTPTPVAPVAPKI